MTAIAIQYRDQIIAKIAQGQRLIDIAQSLGYKDHSAIVHRLKDDPEYMIARETGAEARLEARERELEVAPDSVTVARARELLSHARWRAEREFPARWGTKQDGPPVTNVTFNVLLSTGDTPSFRTNVEQVITDEEEKP